jgi:hypothetical protein
VFPTQTASNRRFREADGQGNQCDPRINVADEVIASIRRPLPCPLFPITDTRNGRACRLLSNSSIVFGGLLICREVDALHHLRVRAFLVDRDGVFVQKVFCPVIALLAGVFYATLSWLR